MKLKIKAHVKKAVDVADNHQKKICIDTVKNPAKGFLGGPSAEEAEKILMEKFHYTQQMIDKLKGFRRRIGNENPH